MYFLEQSARRVLPNTLGNHSFPVYSYGWKQIAVCEERAPLEKLIILNGYTEGTAPGNVRIISNNPQEDAQ